jgi:hypothetical protein
MHLGRVFGTALVGFFLMLFVAIDLVLFGVIALDSALVTILALVGLVAGGVAGWLVGARA